MLALVAATPAKAGEASVTVEAGKVTLVYVANGGETNTVTVTQSADSFAVADATADVTPGAGCAAGATAREATCADPNIQAIRVDLLDLDDVVDIDAQVPSTLLGRTGTDDLTGGDGADTINGGPDPDTISTRGPGRDTVLLCDANDVVFSDSDDTVPAICPNNVSPNAAVTGGPGPDVPTNSTRPSFTFSVTENPEGFVGFECIVDRVPAGPSACSSGQEITMLPDNADGPYALRVRALDEIGPGPWSTPRSFNVDRIAPQINVSGPLVSTTSTPTYEIHSNEVTSFECGVDQAGFSPCASPYTTPPLANGSHVLLVRGTDRAGNQSTSQVGFTVQVGPSGSGTPLKPKTIIIDSLVLISGRAVRMSRKGAVSIRLQCAGNKTCKGRMSITTAEPVKRKSRKLETLGSTKFSIAANKKKNVRVRFSKSKRKLAKRLKRFKAKVVIREVDQRGNARISSRVFILRAR
jgi:hypothetical protein